MNLSFSSYFVGSRLIVVLLALLIVGGAAQTAYADPHAMFYTVTGQQQLFFNTLAALDQADYVEPAKNTTGAPAGSSREELLKSRGAAGFTEEQNSSLNATRTNLSGVVTRNITLEGNDVWSSYLLLQFALERSRTSNSDEITKIFCERGLGLKDCKDTVEARKEQDKAFVTKPEEYAAQPVLRGAIANLTSGLDGHEKIANEELQDNSGPLDFNPNLAQLRATNKGDETKRQVIESIAEGAANTFVAAQINPSALNNINITRNGNDISATYTPPNNQSPAEFIRAYMKKQSDISTLASSLQESSTSSLLSGKAFYDSPAVTGAGGGKGNLETHEYKGAVVANVTLPAGVKDALASAPVGQIATFEANRAYVPANQNSQPGGQQPLAPNGGGQQGGVAGVSSDTDQQAAYPADGKVAAAQSDDDPDHHSSTAPLDPGSLPVAFHHEQSPKDYLGIVSGGDDQGCGCSTHNAVNDFGQLIIRKINGL